MGLVQLSATLSSASTFAVEGHGHEPALTTLEVRITPIPPGTPGLPAGATWAWAVVSTSTAHLGDGRATVLLGGHAESALEAAARGEHSLRAELVKRHETALKGQG